jgi:hypothetical protein
MFRLPGAIFRGYDFFIYKLLQLAFRVGVGYCSLGVGPSAADSTPVRTEGLVSVGNVR